MLYTQEQVQANIRTREGKRVFYLGKGDRLTSSARDYLNRERIPILPAQEAKPEHYLLQNGAVLSQKPEHMTHLQGNVLVSKTHPRILFRGKLDTLEAELILCQLECPELKGPLEEILALARKILRCEVLNEPLEAQTLCGLTQEQLRDRSHFPQEYFGQPHFMPCSADGPVIARLNRTRCAAREAELAAVAAFTDREGNVTGEDLLRALNRMSSMLYILMVQWKAR